MLVTIQIESNRIKTRPVLPLGRLLTTKQADTYLGWNTSTKLASLSKPSKMPCYSYSIPASTCKIGSKLATIGGTICNKCYAKKGMYVFKTTRAAMQRRLDAITSPNWVAALVTLIDAQADYNDTPHFRWHDSGDIQNLKHFAKIVRIARLMPHIQFWIPTREIGIVSHYRKYRDIPANLIIRESTAMINAPIPIATTGRTYSTVHTDTVKQGANECIARYQAGECRDCRACWDTTISCVSYHIH